jgi:exodeoxyribonuclease-5
MPLAPQAVRADKLLGTMLEGLPFEPTPAQNHLCRKLSEFVTSPGNHPLFVVNGYAGTGKTSLLGAFVKALTRLEVNVVLLAPTGRAAKVFSAFAGHKAQTIHKRLYRVNSPDPSSQQFILAPNHDADTVFIVDEASMIGDNPIPQRSLLFQLLRHVYSAPGTYLILVGDNAQLPPVGQPQSPAMNLERLRQLGLEPLSLLLDQTVRQSAKSGILFNANIIRKRIGKNIEGLPTFTLSPFRDIVAISSMDLEDCITSSWSRVGEEETLIITRSNKRAAMINNEVRGRIMYADAILQRGEHVLIAKNNYYWPRKAKEKGLEFIANGETAVVKWMGREHESYGLRFADAEIALPGHDIPLAVKIVLDSITDEASALSPTKMTELYNKILTEEEGSLSERIKAVDDSPFYNALQVKHSYCVTCHKAQGGQWKHVYIDMGAIRVESMDDDFYRWLYTALTRATERVYLINPTVNIR